MKTLENKTTTMQKDGEIKHAYSDLLTLCVNNAPVGGFTPETMAARLRVIEATKKAVDEKAAIQLEDADAKTAKDCVNAMKWGMMHADIVAFTSDCNASL